MNAGKYRDQALAQALANARLTNTRRYLHRDQHGVYWISKGPLTSPLAYSYGSDFVVVEPNGTYASYEPGTTHKEAHDVVPERP